MEKPPDQVFDSLVAGNRKEGESELKAKPMFVLMIGSNRLPNPTLERLVYYCHAVEDQLKKIAARDIAQTLALYPTLYPVLHAYYHRLSTARDQYTKSNSLAREE